MAPPLRIMHVFDRLGVGGTEKGVVKLLHGLDPNLFEQCICAIRGASPDEQSWMRDIPILHGGNVKAQFHFNVPQLVQTMKRFRPAIVHSRNWGGIEAVVAARIAGIPVIIHSEHGYDLEMDNGLPFRQRVLRHLAYRCATAICTVTEELRSYHAAQAWWDSKQIRVLYNGVDSEKFRPSAELRGAVRERLGIPISDLVIGYVGRMIPVKDIWTLVKAFETLVPLIPTLRLLLVGTGPESKRIQEYVAAREELRKRVHLTGNSDDVPAVMNAMDIFVLPSLLEGMSNTLLEAMATGLPSVATTVGGNSEIIVNSISGYLVQPENVHELHNTLHKLLLDQGLRGKLSGAARDRVCRHFSLATMLQGYESLYSELMFRQTVHAKVAAHVRY
jgi:sugar transferase (PEP-CTERM/EpsH1 system associated)